MKKLSKIVLSAFILMMVFSVVSSINVKAVGSPDDVIVVPGNSIQTQLQNHVKTKFLFRERTQLTISSNVDIDLNLNCEVSRIANKDFILEIECDKNLLMVMTCTREENHLDLMEGNTCRTRNRNTYRYQEGFCVSIECCPKCDCECQCVDECQCVCDCECQCVDECQCVCDCECQCQDECQCVCNCDDKDTCIKARLRLRETSENRNGEWAYYEEASEEWVIVPTIIEDGYISAETDHFSTWTVLIPTTSNTFNTTLIFGSSLSIAVIGVIIGISIMTFRKRKED